MCAQYKFKCNCSLVCVIYHCQTCVMYFIITIKWLSTASNHRRSYFCEPGLECIIQTVERGVAIQLTNGGMWCECGGRSAADYFLKTKAEFVDLPTTINPLAPVQRVLCVSYGPCAEFSDVRWDWRYRDSLKGLYVVWWILLLLLLTSSASTCLQHSRNHVQAF